jgi:hypothetical protein
MCSQSWRYGPARACEGGALPHSGAAFYLVKVAWVIARQTSCLLPCPNRHARASFRAMASRCSRRSCAARCRQRALQYSVFSARDSRLPPCTRCDGIRLWGQARSRRPPSKSSRGSSVKMRGARQIFLESSLALDLTQARPLSLLALSQVCPLSLRGFLLSSTR